MPAFPFVPKRSMKGTSAKSFSASPISTMSCSASPIAFWTCGSFRVAEERTKGKGSFFENFKQHLHVLLLDAKHKPLAHVARSHREPYGSALEEKKTYLILSLSLSRSISISISLSTKRPVPEEMSEASRTRRGAAGVVFQRHVLHDQREPARDLLSKRSKPGLLSLSYSLS